MSPNGVEQRNEFVVALRYDPEERRPYTVCAFHARGDMVSLSDLVAAIGAKP